MNPFRKSREFSLFRQMVFGDRAGAPDQRNPLGPRVFTAAGAQQPTQRADDGEADVQTDSEIE